MSEIMSEDRPPLARGNRLKQLRAFCHAARLQSITRAAEYIFLSQPAVSQLVRALEDDLGVTLFERKGPRISLSPVGDRLFRMAMPVVAGMDRLPDTFAEQYRGEVSEEFRIAAGRATAAYVVPEYLKRFRDRYPGTRVNVRTGTGRERLEWLRAYEVDLVFGAVDVPPADLEFIFMFASRSVLITPEHHPLAGRKSVGLAEAAAYPAVMHGGERHVRRVAEMVARLHGLTIDVVVEVEGWNLIKRYVEAGVGYSVVPDFCLTERDRVWRVPFDRYFSGPKYGLLMRPREVPSLASQRFVRLAVPDVPELPRK